METRENKTASQELRTGRIYDQWAETYAKEACADMGLELEPNNIQPIARTIKAACEDMPNPATWDTPPNKKVQNVNLNGKNQISKRLFVAVVTTVMFCAAALTYLLYLFVRSMFNINPSIF